MTSPGTVKTSAAPLGFLVVAAAAASISVANVLSPVVYDQGSNPATLLAFRFGSFLLLCGLWLRVHKITMVPERRHLVHCAGAGLAYTIGSGALITAFAFMPVSLVVLIFYTFPLMTRLAESALDRRWPTVWEVACLLTALSGLVICLGIGLDRLNGPGLALSVLAAAGVAASLVWSGRKLSSIPPTVTTFHMAAIGLIAVLCVTTVTQSWALPPLEPVATGLMAAAALSFAGAFLGMFAGVRLIGASRAAMVMNLEPVLTVALAIFLLNEDLSVHQFLGAALVIGAIIAAQFRKTTAI